MLIHEHALVKVREDMPHGSSRSDRLLDHNGRRGSVPLLGSNLGQRSSYRLWWCGLAAINGAAIAGAGQIIAVDRVDSKLELAKSVGATHVVNAAEKDAVGEVENDPRWLRLCIRGHWP